MGGAKEGMVSGRGMWVGTRGVRGINWVGGEGRGELSWLGKASGWD